MISTNKIQLTIFAAAFFAVALTLSASLSIAQNSNSQSLKTFVTPDVIGFAYLDLENMDLKEATELLGKMGFRETINFKKMKASSSIIEEEITTLKSAGLSRCYALLRTSDFQAQGTSFVFPLKAGSDADKAKEALGKVLEKYIGNRQANYQLGHRNGALFAAAGPQFERLQNGIADGETDRADIWKSIDGGSMGVVVFGDRDSRRVVKELMPALPSPFDRLNGKLVADDTKWIGLSAKLDGNPEINLEIETSSEQAAKVYTDVINAGLKMAKFAPQVREMIPKSEIKFVFDSIAPQRNGTRVTMSASKVTKDLDRLAKIMAPQVKAMRAAAARTQKMNTVRQLMLAILNYESTHGHFPTQYSADATGKPLLSWRVHILPFIGQRDLYEKFKLDEPWDSKNNIKLLGQMPEAYWDKRGEAFERNQEGKIIFQVAAGDKLLFNGTKEYGFGDITDGSSNTASVITMPTDKAVPWTKPVDWNVDLNHPLEDLKGEDRKEVVVAFCDGSTHVFPIAKPDVWSRFLQPEDGSVVRFEEFDE